MSTMERLSADSKGRIASPFLDQELLVERFEDELEPHAAALATESPFVGALQETRSSFEFDNDQLLNEQSADGFEDKGEWEAGEMWEVLEEERLSSDTDQEEEDFIDDGAPLQEDETDHESSDAAGDYYFQVQEHELNQGENLAELTENQDLEPDGERLEWLTEDTGEEEWEKDEVEFEEQEPHPLITFLITQGSSENEITNEVFYQRNPKLRGQALRPKSKPAQQWESIRSREVRPAMKRRLALEPVNPVTLAIFFSQYEDDSRVPAGVTDQFLIRAPLLSMGKTLRDRIISNWRLGKPPLTLDRLNELAYEVSGSRAAAMLLCHNVTKSFARGGKAIVWDRSPKAPLTYSDGKNFFTPKVIHWAGKITKKYSEKYKQELPSIYYLLFSEKEFGTYDPGDWYHYYVGATMTAYSAVGLLRHSAPVSDQEKHVKKAIEPVEDFFYPIVVGDLLHDLESQMSNPDLKREPGYRGWVLANVLSFLEGGHFGETQEDVARESRFHLRGALAGLRAAGVKPGKNWVWYVPQAQSLSQEDLLFGFLLRNKTFEELDAAGKRVGTPKKSSK